VVRKQGFVTLRTERKARGDQFVVGPAFTSFCG
jgi:hypothetical protein